jgi:hypothetical protein
MAVPRPLLLALVGLLLLSATFFATRASRGGTESTVPSQAATPQKPSAPRSEAKPHKPARASTSHSAASKDHPARAVRAHRAASLAKPAAVARALSRGKVVVISFFQPGADDRASAASVDALRGRHLAVVFTDRIANVGRYGPLVEKIGIDQAPAIVIVDHHRRARLIQGYVDSETLAQEVSDARG